MVPKGAAPGSGGGGDGSVALLERVAGAADELRLSLESFSGVGGGCLRREGVGLGWPGMWR